MCVDKRQVGVLCNLLMLMQKLLEFDYGDTDEEEESRDDNRFQHLKTSFG